LSKHGRIQRSLGAAPFAHAFDDRLAVAPNVSPRMHIPPNAPDEARLPRAESSDSAYYWYAAPSLV